MRPTDEGWDEMISLDAGPIEPPAEPDDEAPPLELFLADSYDDDAAWARFCEQR